MLRVIFVCLGNICRSPMAEAVFKSMVKEEGLSLSFSIDSFATSSCEEGNPVYPPAAKVLSEKGYAFTHRAKTIGLADIVNADYVLCMDDMNLADLKTLGGKANYSKIYLLGSFHPNNIIIADPWYTRDFERTYSEITASLTNFLSYLKSHHSQSFTYDKYNY